MKKLLTIVAIAGLVAVAGLSLGCNKLSGSGGDNSAKVDALNEQITQMQEDIDALYDAVDALQEDYDAHLEEFHGEKPATTPKTSGGSSGKTNSNASKPPREKIK